MEASGNDEPPCGPLTPRSRILVLRSPKTLQSAKAQGTPPPEKTRVQNFCGNFLVASAGLFFGCGGGRRGEGATGSKYNQTRENTTTGWNIDIDIDFLFLPKQLIVAASIMTLVVLELRGLR